MLQTKIEEAIAHKYIAKIIFSGQAEAIYGVFTGRIKVLSNITENQVTSTYRYYLKEIDLEDYKLKKDVNKSLKSLRTIMHDQIVDIEQSMSSTYPNSRGYL